MVRTHLPFKQYTNPPRLYPMPCRINGLYIAPVMVAHDRYMLNMLKKEICKWCAMNYRCVDWKKNLVKEATKTSVCSQQIFAATFIRSHIFHRFWKIYTEVFTVVHKMIATDSEEQSFHWKLTVIHFWHKFTYRFVRLCRISKE